MAQQLKFTNSICERQVFFKTFVGINSHKKIFQKQILKNFVQSSKNS